jgi:hypothetical protein
MQGPPGARGAFACRTVVVAAVLIACGGRARAAEPELGLAWQAPAGCPSPAEVEAQFVRLLGGETRLPSGKHIDATAVVRSSAPDRWSLELATVLDGAPGRRNLTGDSCASVSSAAALILALMIDPAAAERAILAPPARPPEPAHAAPPPATPPTVVATAPAAEPRALHAFARVFGGSVVALLPDPAPAAGVALGARRRRLAAEATFVATSQRRVSAAADVGGDFRLLAGGARACGALGGRAVVWQLCAGGELEWLTGTGVTSPALTPTILMGAATGGLLVTVPLGARFGLSLDLDGALRLYHPAFCALCQPQVDNGTQVLRVPAANAFGALGIFVTL